MIKECIPGKQEQYYYITWVKLTEWQRRTQHNNIHHINLQMGIYLFIRGGWGLANYESVYHSVGIIYCIVNGCNKYIVVYNA